MSTAGAWADEQKLAELGYKQELNRGWSGFSNFAISFSIICILAGCFTTYGQALKNGGPIAISIAWPLICVLILVRRRLDVRARVGLSDGRRHLLLGVTSGRRRLGLVHRLVQPDRPRRRGGVSDLRERDVPDLPAGSLQRQLHLQLREGRRGDERALQRARQLRHVRGHRDHRGADQRVLEPPRVALLQRLGVVEHHRRPGHRRAPRRRPLTPREPLVRLQPPRQRIGLLRRRDRAAANSGSTCYRSASC